MSDTSTMQTLEIFLSAEDAANSTGSRELQQPDKPPPPRPQEPHRAKKDNDDHVDGVFVPTKFDVICGWRMDTIPRNGHFNDLCEAMAEAYQTTCKRGRARIVLSIVNAIHEKQGRFIKQQRYNDAADGVAQQWQVLSLQAAIDKISHCIRDILKRQKNKTTRPNTMGLIDLQPDHAWI
jgi:hypothetical protein